MTQAPPRPAGSTPRPRVPHRLTVLESYRLRPSMQRIVAGGPGFARFAGSDRAETDRYVKLLVFPPSVTVPSEPFDMAGLRDLLPPDALPTVRTYTLRDVDHAAQQLTVDFVVHGDDGVAGPWAARARPGDPMVFNGPGGGYRPRRDVDWHLLAGDDAALPAIAAALADLPAGARAQVVVEVDSEVDEQPLPSAADVSLTWLHRAGRPAGSTTLIADAVRALPWPAGVGQAFVHGESALLRSLKPYLARERGMPAELLSISGYWRRGDDEERFREWKRTTTSD